MQTYSVEAVLSAVDRGFSEIIEKANQKIKDFDKNTDKLPKSENNFRSTFGAMALANIATGALSTLTGGLGNMIGETIKASDAMDKFKSTMDFAGKTESETQRASQAVKDYADKTVYELTDVANTTAQLASNGISNYVELTQAAGNLNAVAGGNAETFKSVAMVMTQTAGAGKLTTENWNQLADAIPGASGRLQEAMLKNGAYTGNFRDAMSQGQITAEEFNKAIMDLGMEDAAKEAATSTKTFEGAIGDLQASIVTGMSGILEAIGKDRFTGAISGIKEFIEGGLKVLAKVIPPIIDAVSSLFKVLSENKGVVVALTGAIAGFKTAMLITSVISSVTKALTKFKTAQKATTVAQAVLNAVMNANPFVLIATAIAAVVAVLIYLWNTNEGFREAIINAWEAIKAAFSSAAEWVKQAWQGVVEFFTTLWEAIKLGAQSFVDWINSIWTGITTAVTVMKDTVVAIWNTIWTLATEIWNNIVNAISEVLQPYITIFSTIWDGIKNVVLLIWETIKSIVNVAIEFVRGIISSVMQILSGDWSGAWDTIKNTLSTAWESMKDIVDTFINQIKSIITTTWDSILSTLQSIWNNITDAASRAWDTLKRGVSEAVESVTGFFDNLWDIDLFGAGKAIMQGFINGLKSMWDSVTSFVGNIASWIADNKGPISYDRKLLIPAGSAIMHGLDTSLRDGFKSVQNRVSGMADSLQSQFDINASASVDSSPIGAQPAYITFSLGNNDYVAFVEDITQAQNNRERIRLKTR